jgi:hypothetical protein
MADIENPIALEKSQDSLGSSKAQEAGEFPPGVMEKAREYGVQPSQWQQYGAQIQGEYDRIVKLIMKEYRMLDEVEQKEILLAIQSGDDSALDDVLLHVEARLSDQDRALPSVMNNLKKVAAKNILQLAAEGKLGKNVVAQRDETLAQMVDILIGLFRALNQPEQDNILINIKQGNLVVLDSLLQNLPMLGYKTDKVDLNVLKQSLAQKLVELV